MYIDVYAFVCKCVCQCLYMCMWKVSLANKIRQGEKKLGRGWRGKKTQGVSECGTSLFSRVGIKTGAGQGAN